MSSQQATTKLALYAILYFVYIALTVHSIVGKYVVTYFSYTITGCILFFLLATYSCYHFKEKLLNLFFQLTKSSFLLLKDYRSKYAFLLVAKNNLPYILDSVNLALSAANGSENNLKFAIFISIVSRTIVPKKIAELFFSKINNQTVKIFRFIFILFQAQLVLDFNNSNKSYSIMVKVFIDFISIIYPFTFGDFVIISSKFGCKPLKALESFHNFLHGHFESFDNDQVASKLFCYYNQAFVAIKNVSICSLEGKVLKASNVFKNDVFDIFTFGILAQISVGLIRILIPIIPILVIRYTCAINCKEYFLAFILAVSGSLITAFHDFTMKEYTRKKYGSCTDIGKFAESVFSVYDSKFSDILVRCYAINSNAPLALRSISHTTKNVDKVVKADTTCDTFKYTLMGATNLICLYNSISGITKQLKSDLVL